MTLGEEIPKLFDRSRAARERCVFVAHGEDSFVHQDALQSLFLR